MKLLMRILFAAALCALVSAPVSAQNAAPRPKDQPFSALAQAETVDVAAQTVSIRRAELLPRQQLPQNDLVAFDLTPTFKANRVELAIAVESLRVGDIVSLLEPKSAATTNAASSLRPAYRWTQARRENFTALRSQVISLSPLTLRSGVLPAGAKFENGQKLIFHLGSYRNRIGTLWLGTGQEVATHSKSLRLNSKGEVTNFSTPSVKYQVSTLQLTQPEGLEFNRYTPLNLSEVGAALAAENAYVLAILDPSPGGKQRVDSLLILDKN